MDCPINKPRPFDWLWYTKKFQGPGFRYEIALNVRTGEICWINGPFQCGPWPDGTIFMDGLFHELVGNEMVCADKGYRGKPRCWTWYDQPSHAERKQASIVRARHETVNARFKVFKSLSTAFRHPRNKDHFFSVLWLQLCSWTCAVTLLSFRLITGSLAT